MLDIVTRPGFGVAQPDAMIVFFLLLGIAGAEGGDAMGEGRVGREKYRSVEPYGVCGSGDFVCKIFNR